MPTPPRLRLALPLILLFLSALPVPLAAQTVPQSREQISLTFAPVVRQVAPAVTNIYTKTVVERRESPFAGDPFFERLFPNAGRTRRRMENSLGSGVIVAPDGLVVTAEHVIRNAVEITVALADRREYNARVLLDDRQTDLAVLQLEGAGDLPFVALGESDALEVGDLLLAIGNPFGVGQTVTSGILSAQARTGSGGQTYLQTDAAINPGNSGGALVDMQGRLVGINSAILTRSGGSNGIGFAVPSSLVSQAIHQAREGKSSLQRPWLGLQAQKMTAELAGALGLASPQGVLIRKLHPASPLASADLRAGEVILFIDEEAIDDPTELDFRLAAKGIGATARLSVLGREGTREVSVGLIAPPELPPADVSRLDQPPHLRGVIVGNLSPAAIIELGFKLDDTTQGVAVFDMRNAARWLQRSLRKGDVLRGYNGTEVASVSGLQAAIERSPDLQLLEIERDGRPISLRFGG
ncbi:MAG: trypsin-like peptidase domain-containing protein [Neomegalonema sp.]|nr:trypsin-like peptidase domain-containing protein [Neomegalonema sp.]